MENAAAKLPVRRLGRTGIETPAVGLGGVGVGGGYGPVDEAEALATIHAALEAGITLIDTSPLYGRSEERIGHALEGVPRDSYFLSTKSGTHPDRRGDFSRDGTLWSVENSLKLLRTDFVDVLHVHDPDDVEAVFAPGAALDTLDELKAQGVVRAIGMGVRSHAFLRRAIESGRFDAILTYNDFHALRRSALDLARIAAEHDVGVLNGSPLAHGLLSGVDPDAFMERRPMPVSPGELAAARQFYRWSRASGVAMPAVVFQMCVREPLIGCTLCGPKNRAELEQNLRAAVEPLPEQTWRDVAALNLEEIAAGV